MNRMKMRFAVILAGAMSLVGSAYAGYRSSGLYVVATSTSGSGSLADARLSSDTRQYIGCNTRIYRGGSEYVSCTAVDAAGNYASCWNNSGTTASNNFIKTVRTLTSDAYLEFTFDTAEYLCAGLYIANHSYLSPKR
jgi:hypothetical protein